MKKLLYTLILSCLAVVVYAQPDSKSIDGVVAVVADRIILRSDLEEQIIQYSQSGNPIHSNTRCKLFEELLFQELLVNQAKLDSLEVSEDEVQSEMNRRIAFFVQQIGSEKKLEEFYGKSMAQIKAEFHDVIQDQLYVQRMKAEITASISMTPKEVKNFYKSIPEDSLPYINAQVEIAQIVIKPPISDVEKQNTINRLKSFRDRIMNGEDFGTLAYLYSEDPGSARKNGELGFVTRGQLVPEFAAVAFTLTPGEVSEVVETEYGFHIIQLIERQGQKVNCRHILLTPEVRPEDMVEAKNKLDSIRNQIVSVDSITFKNMALKYSEDKETRQNGGKMMNYATGDAKFEMNELNQIDPSLFFVLDKMEPGDISKPVVQQKEDGSKAYRIVKLLSISEPHKANLRDDYERIQQAAKSEKENKAVADWIEKKIKSTYIRLDDEFKSCDFDYVWVKEEE
tara:strand:+ start:2548 stop:3909 length:1362 start_codon:yes stop_codon:yes gene_type:complete